MERKTGRGLPSSLLPAHLPPRHHHAVSNLRGHVSSLNNVGLSPSDWSLLGGRGGGGGRRGGRKDEKVVHVWH